MALVVEGLGFPPEMLAQLATNAEERKAFASDLRQMLAAAEEAQAAGLRRAPRTEIADGALARVRHRAGLLQEAQADGRDQPEAGRPARGD